MRQLTHLYANQHDADVFYAQLRTNYPDPSIVPIRRFIAAAIRVDDQRPTPPVSSDTFARAGTPLYVVQADLP